MPFVHCLGRAALLLAVGGGGPLVTVADLYAQGAPVEAGDRVRVTGPGSKESELIGTVVRKSADSLWLASTSGDTLGVASAPGRRLERSDGMHGHALTGALIGGAIGTAATVVFLSQFCGGDTLCDGDEEVRAAAIFGLPALAAGTIIGALTKSERWEPVVLVGGTGRAPGSRQVRLGLVVRW